MDSKKTKMLSLIVAGLALFFAAPPAASAAFEYRLLESFPGFFAAGQLAPDLPTMILAIYKFGIWTVGIAGLFMLVIGGFTYMASAGNTSTAGSAKGIIWDSILGIVAALAAYLILYVINPDLTRINITFVPVGVATEGSPMGPAGVCEQAPTVDCSVANIKTLTGRDDDTWAQQASAICNGESNGANISSTIDICRGNGTNDPVSVGLFQINLSVHKMAGLPCKDAFNMEYTSASVGSQCYVTDRSLYDRCVAAAKIPANNIAAMLEIYQAGTRTYKPSWKPWGANRRSGCNFP